MKDKLMEIEMQGTAHTLFGSLDYSKIENKNERPKYNGSITKVGPEILVDAYHTFSNLEGIQYCSLGGALAQLRKNDPKINGILLTGHEGINSMIEGIEAWSTSWQAYILDNHQNP